MDFDTAFKKVGTFGRFQYLIMSACFFLNFTSAFQMVMMDIVGAKPDKDIPSEANMTTIVTEWNLYSTPWVNDAIGSIFMGGYLTGIAILGQLPDLVGRKPVLILAAIGIITTTLASSFSPHWQAFAAIRFFSGLSLGAAGGTIYVFMCEMLGKEYWGSVSMVYSVSFSIGFMGLALLGYLIQNWRTLCIVIALLPAPSVPFFLFFTPESPRWLYSVGKIEKCEKALKKIARINGNEDNEVKLSAVTSGENLHKYSIIDLCKIKKLLIRLLISCFAWFCCSFVYYGLSLDASDLTPNLFIAIALSGGIEIPSTLLNIFILRIKWLGRKGSVIFLFLLCGTANIGLIYVDMNAVTVSTIKTVLGLVGKLSIAAAFAILYLYSSELFPTQLRVTAVSTSSVLARAGAMIAPFIPLLASSAPYLPYIVISISSILPAFVVLWVPETLGMPVPKMPLTGREQQDGETRGSGKYGTFNSNENENYLIVEENGNEEINACAT